MAIIHSTVATKADEAGAEVNKDEWNDDHVLGGTALEPTTDSTTSLGSSSKRYTTGFVDAMAGFAMEATLDLGGFLIDSLATPTADEHGANKGYVDSVVGGSTHDIFSATHNDTSGSVATSDVMQFDGTFWLARNLTEAGIAAASHNHTSDEVTDYSGVHTSDDITDYSGQHTSDEISDYSGQHAKADITDFAHDLISASHGDTSGTVATSDVFQYDGSFWLPRTLTEAGIAAASHTHTSDEVTDYSGVHTSDDITDYSGQHTSDEITDYSGQHAKADITDFAHDLVSSSHSDSSPSVSPVTDDVLQWTGTEWLATGITAAAAAHDILSSSHGDTSPSITPVTDDVLTWSGTEWIATDAAGGGGDLTQWPVPCVMEVPEGTVAHPDIHTLGTAGAKVSGFVMPDGASTSTINFKCVVPPNLASTPAMKIRARIMALGSVAGPADVRLVVRTLGIADAENLDSSFTSETTATVTMPATLEFTDYYTQDITTDWAEADTVIGQILRDPTDGSDDFTDDIMIVGVELLADFTPA